MTLLTKGEMDGLRGRSHDVRSYTATRKRMSTLTCDYIYELCLYLRPQYKHLDGYYKICILR
jgi:hypothetical protein